MILQKIGNALEKGVGGLEKAGSGIGEMLAQLGGNYAPPDLDLTNRQKRGLLGARLNDMTYGPGAGPKQTPDFLNNIRANNERQRRQDIINSPETASQLAAIADPAQRAMFQSMLDTGDVSGFQSAMYNANLESRSKNAMMTAAENAGFDEVELAMMGGMTAEQIQAFLEDYYDKEKDAGKLKFDQSNTLYQRFEKAPETKIFKETERKFNNIQTYVSNPSPASDMSLVFAFMQMNDPGSTVREGEYALAESADAPLQRYTKGLYNQLLTGQRLTPSARANFFKNAGLVFERDLEKYEKLLDSSRTQAANFGIDFDTDVMVGAAPQFDKNYFSENGGFAEKLKEVKAYTISGSDSTFDDDPAFAETVYNNHLVLGSQMAGILDDDQLTEEQKTETIQQQFNFSRKQADDYIEILESAARKIGVL